MRALIFFSLVAALCSCANDAPVDRPSLDSAKSVLELPKVEAGIPIDTTLPEIHIAVKIDVNGQHPFVETKRWPQSPAGRDTINVYAHDDVPCGFVEHVIDSLCNGKNLRIIGINNGLELGIPFHVTDRFNVARDTQSLHTPSYKQLRMNEAGLVAVDSTLYERDEMEKFFSLFYGNAFMPKDSLAFPQRRPQVQSISALEHQAMAWDASEKNTGPDSAIFLAAYNEFVNKLEIFQKVGVFYTMHLAMMDIHADSMTTWGNFVHVLSTHRMVQEKRRADAKRYLAEKLANDGRPDTQYEFTDEDLLLLYPDRLRWNGRMSGPTEHLEDPFHLHVFKIAEVVPVAPVQMIPVH
jgi:hypothetical protein